MKLLDVLAGATVTPPPIWMMRQAGRYLPEYRALRATAPSFLDFCYSPKLAAAATLQPIQRFQLDAAILFSDILVIPDALGQHVTFETGEGPKLDPISDSTGLSRLRETLDQSIIDRVLEAISQVRSKLSANVPLIGFCGAPWTVASYMIAGKGTPDQGPARIFAYRHPDLFADLIATLVRVSIDYLKRQLQAGVHAVQIFDSWAGVLPTMEFRLWCFAPIVEIVEGVRRDFPDAKIIVFPRAATSHLEHFTSTAGIAALGLDTSTDCTWAAKTIPNRIAIQGNLDPLALLAGGQALETGVQSIRSALRDRPHIFNLGHGILPQTPIENVEHLLKLVRAS